MNKQITKILDNFNFQAVHDHMVTVDWNWGGFNGDGYVPTIDELMKTATRLLTSVHESDLMNSSHACGGFHAHKWTFDPDKSPTLELLFVVENWDA